ncbi:MAG: WhiB family transcriptional regulator [Ferrimicrobium sp.]
MAESWRDYAACRGWDTSLFFAPEDSCGESDSARRIREGQAKQICRRCSAREACLEWALHNRETRGIWGGQNELERKALLRARRKLHVVA